MQELNGLPDRVDTERRIREIHEFAEKNHTLKPEEVLTALEEAIALCRAINDIPMLLKSMYRYAYGLRIQLRLDEALQILNSALEIGLQSGLKSETGIVYNNIANYYYALGNYSEAKTYFLKHAHLYGELGDFTGQVESLATVALMSINEGNLSEAFGYCQQGFDICKAMSIAHPFHLYYNTANVYENVGEIQKALEYYFETLKIAEHNNYLTVQALTNAAISRVYQDNGDPGSALEYSIRALALHDKFVNPGEKVLTLVLLADNLISLGRLDEAEHYLHQGSEIVRGKNLRPKELRLHMSNASLFIRKKQPDEAMVCLEHALALTEELQSNRDTVRILLEMGKISGCADREKLLTRALSMAKEIGFKAKFPDVYFALYEYFEQKGELLKAFDFYKLFHVVKQEIQGEESVKRMQVAQLQHDAERARLEAAEMRLKSEMLEQEIKLRAQQLQELTADVIQKNQVLSQIRQNSLEAMRQHGLKQKNTLQAIVKIAEKGATSFWQQLEERSKFIEGNFTENMLRACPELSPVELRILLLLKQGISNKEISQILFIGERTIEYHRTSIRKKLHLGRSGNLVTYINSLSA